MTVISTEAALPAIDSTELRRCLGTFVTGVTVITALDADGQPEGITANSFSSLSLDPPLIVWSLRLNARSFNTYQNAERFAVNILAQDQVHISNRFAASGIKRFEGVAHTSGIDGVPLIDGCAAYLECRLQATYPGGDHALFVARVERIQVNDRPPLAYGAGAYLSVRALDVA
jgi:flavin reductase (DIM6/NTAB) family NADH-FMN oxidoreductase RutF